MIYMAGLANTYQAAGKLDLALPLWEETLTLTKHKLGADHPRTISTMNNLGKAYRDAGKLDLALPLLEDTLKRAKVKFAADDPNTIVSMGNLATCYQAVGKLNLALPLLEETLKLTKHKLGADHPYTLIGMTNLALGYRDAGKLDRALPLLKEAARGAEKTHFPQRIASKIVNGLADCHEDLKELHEAEAWRRKWLSVVKEREGADSPPYATALAGLGSNLLKQKQWTDAEATVSECLAIRQKKEPDAWSTFDTQSMLGQALLGQKKYAEAEKLLLSGYEGMQQRAAKIPPKQKKARLSEALEHIVQLYDATGNKLEADKWRKKLEEAKKVDAK
jgi:tetratricopeptide (TPR) repeat protein